MIRKIFAALLLIFAIQLNAQEVKLEPLVFSIKQALDYGLKNNYALKNAQTDVSIAKKVVKETTAIGLPQINASVSNTNYINIPTTLMPDFISPAVYGVNMQNFGLVPLTPLSDEAGTFPVKFGTKYNANADLSISQLLFSGEYLIGLRASKTYLAQTAQLLVKSEQNLKENIQKSYFLVLSIKEQIDILKKTKKANIKLLNETKKMLENGFVEDTDVDQLSLLVNNLDINIKHLSNEQATALDYLKMNMGMPIEQKLGLSDRLEDLMGFTTSKENSAFQLDNNIDFQLMKTQINLADLQIKREQSTYLPQLSAFFDAQTNAMRDQFNFLDSKGTWFPTTLWGFKLNIPIWSSGSRSAKIKQAKLTRLKLDESSKQLAASVRLEVRTAENNLSLHLNEYKSSLKNLSLSKKIYSKTQLKYKEGMTSSFDLIQAHNNFLSASGTYISSILNVLNDRVTLKRLYSQSDSNLLK